jgi:hypothetical protein
MPSAWYTSGCSPLAYRVEEDGSFNVQGDGVVVTPLPPNVPPWQAMVEDAATATGVPAHVIAGVMSFESGGKANAGSPAGAMGLMQLMGATANGLAGTSLTSAQVYDPATNIRLGTQLLANLSKRYGGNVVQMLFAYNAGSVVCGGGVSHGYSDPSDKGQPCAANVWGCVADCYSSSVGTVDYASPVLHYANAALAAGWGQGASASLVPADGPLSVTDGLVGLGLLGLGFAAGKQWLVPWLSRRRGGR